MPSRLIGRRTCSLLGVATALRGQMEVDAGRLILEAEEIEDRSRLPLGVVDQLLVANLENAAGRRGVDSVDHADIIAVEAGDVALVVGGDMALLRTSS